MHSSKTVTHPCSELRVSRAGKFDDDCEKKINIEKSFEKCLYSSVQKQNRGDSFDRSRIIVVKLEKCCFEKNSDISFEYLYFCIPSD